MVSLLTGEPVGPGEVGEIQARSDSLMAGYLPCEATRDALCDGWYRTGDVGYLDTGGWLRITDRAKEMIKVRGFPGRARRDRGRAARLTPPSKTVRCSESPTASTGSRWSPPSRRGHRSTPPNSVARVGERLASYKRLSRVVFVPEIPRLPSRKGAAPSLQGALWMYV